MTDHENPFQSSGSADGRLSRRRARRWWTQRPRERVAFVLAGGGVRGALQVGMLAELVDQGIKADRVFGVSVGAVNAAAYCSDPTKDGMKKLEDVWVNLHTDDVFPHGRVHGPWLFLQHRESVYPNRGLRKILEGGLTVGRIEDTEIPLEVLATRMADGTERWFTEGRIVEPILASAAIPGVFPPVTVDGDALIDGGVVNNVPLSRAIAEGFTRIYVLLCGPAEYRARRSTRPIESVISAFFTSIYSRFPRDLEEASQSADVIVFKGPDRSGADFRDFTASEEMIEEGRAEVRALLERVPSHPGRSSVREGRQL
jgi:NTE family protein